jgi:hypothetical protein
MCLDTVAVVQPEGRKVLLLRIMGKGFSWQRSSPRGRTVARNSFKRRFLAYVLF